MRTSDMFPSKYLSESDLAGKPAKLVMRAIEFEEVGQQRDRKPVLYFERAQKGLVLNKTNMRKIEQLYGNETDDWSGKPVELYPSETDFQGETVPCIRVRAPRPANGTQPARKPAALPVYNDEGATGHHVAIDERNPPMLDDDPNAPPF